MTRNTDFRTNFGDSNSKSAKSLSKINRKTAHRAKFATYVLHIFYETVSWFLAVQIMNMNSLMKHETLMFHEANMKTFHMRHQAWRILKNKRVSTTCWVIFTSHDRPGQQDWHLRMPGSPIGRFLCRTQSFYSADGELLSGRIYTPASGC